MPKRTLILLLIAVFIAGCTHAKPFYYQAEGQAQPQPRAQYCPVAVFEGHKQLETPVCSGGVPFTMSQKEDSNYNMGVYQNIKARRDELSACYTAHAANEDGPGMFFADLAIFGNGKIIQSFWVNASINPDIKPLNPSPEMIGCFNKVLKDVEFPTHRHKRHMVRAYFVRHPETEKDSESKQEKTFAIYNHWSTKGLQSSDPFEDPAQVRGNGHVNWSDIAKVIRRELEKINYCYSEELDKNPELKGKIVIKFTIGKDGYVTRSAVRSTTMNNPAVEQCMLDAFETFVFPKPKGGGIVVVSYPFVFKPVN